MEFAIHVHVYTPTLVTTISHLSVGIYLRSLYVDYVYFAVWIVGNLVINFPSSFQWIEVLAEVEREWFGLHTKFILNTIKSS